VVVPGLGLSAAVVAGLVHEIGGRVVRLPAYGLPVTSPQTPPQLAGLLLAELRGAGLERVVLVAHSSSCQVVVEAAVADPARVAGLVLVGPTTDPRARSWPRLAGRWLATALGEPPWQVPRLVRDYRRAGVVGLLRTMDLARRHRIEDAARAVRCPVRVVRGRRDRIAPARWTRALAAVLRGASCTLPAGGHMVPLTHPVLVGEQVRRVLSGAG
jgi:pimeloyl-ACP methyl ester carboxylesterase